MTHLTAAAIMDRSEATLSPDLDIYLALTQLLQRKIWTHRSSNSSSGNLSVRGAAGLLSISVRGYTLPSESPSDISRGQLTSADNTLTN